MISRLAIVFAFIFVTSLFVTEPSLAVDKLADKLADKSADKKKSKISTQLFEHDGEATSVSGKVKVVREIQEETEVFVDNPKGSSGPFILPANIKDRARLIKLLNASQKPGGPPVELGIDAQQRITHVESSAKGAASADSN
ncbi:MAG: hypothetical protein H7326_05275 [Bdellovibrionaceae bacterium]|nr:hypothetical protein [Pseudobdellovibrionaceae bacterium]